MTDGIEDSDDNFAASAPDPRLDPAALTDNAALRKALNGGLRPDEPPSAPRAGSWDMMNNHHEGPAMAKKTIHNRAVADVLRYAAEEAGHYRFERDALARKLEVVNALVKAHAIESDYTDDHPIRAIVERLSAACTRMTAERDSARAEAARVKELEAAIDRRADEYIALVKVGALAAARVKGLEAEVARLNGLHDERAEQYRAAATRVKELEADAAQYADARRVLWRDGAAARARVIELEDERWALLAVVRAVQDVRGAYGLHTCVAYALEALPVKLREEVGE